jgi:hypothetical protein
MEEKVEIAKEVAKQIDSIAGISCASVDDYNRYGNFQIVAYLDLYKNNQPKNKSFNMRSITNGIKKILKETKQVSKIGISVDAPQRLYDTYTCLGTTDRYFKGYERSYVMIDFTITLPNELCSISELLL